MLSSPPDISKVFSDTRTVAIIGCSSNIYRTSNYAARFLQDKGFRIIPVNPNEDRIAGETCYASLNDIPEHIQVDLVNVFRNSEFSADAVKDVIERKQATGQIPVIWTQLDVSSPEAEQLAEEADIPYIRNRCIMVELDRLQ